ncbi:Immunogenic protein [Rhodovulum sp. P5]|uniref:TAXI family TRAP transporter solute-binding subunit n=1 Tax=Rhodovulum sp. P5 TaxID=1564506 RepID=UPI0009C23B92|nr:TAXI family TRAP transporter solute-binding subunit [Rhodovulum sp. P5]ARE40753.1 Immunogenic protein [Rhodovulum sp. P5]
MIPIIACSRRLAAALALIVACAVPAVASDVEKNIVTGGPTGTYIQFGQDIADIAAECDITLTVNESAGSLENFLAVRQRPVTQFGIVQSDVLEYLSTFAADDAGIANAIAGVRIAFPLYNEEVHLLATSDIQSLSDLEGKRVAIGVSESGTFLTAALVLDLAEVQVGERLTIGPDDSLRRLLAGEIDAFFYVAGAPTKLFEDPAIDGERFHLVPMNDPVLQAVYVPSTIAAGTYPFQPAPVDAVAVKAVLMTYEYLPERNRYYRESCLAVSEITHLIVTRFQKLKETGHPKWQQVDLNAIPPGWEVGSCVNAGLEASFTLPCDRVMGAAQPSEESRANSVYRERICAAMGGC